MDKKNIFSILFLLFNILTFVYSQGENGQAPDPKDPQPTPTPTTTNSNSAQAITTSAPNPNITPQASPSTTSSTANTFTSDPPFNNSPGGIIQNNPNNPHNPEPLPPQTILDDHNLIMTTVTTAPPVTQPVAPKRTTSQKKATIVKTYPQVKFEPILPSNN